MKRTITYLIVIFVVMATLLCLNGIPAFAEEILTGACGETLSWSLDLETETLTISGEGPMKDYTSGSTPWKQYANQIKTVVVQEGVTTIGCRAFSGLRVLTDVSLPQSLRSIGECGFINCTSLEQIRLNDGLQRLERGVFYGCSTLQILAIPDTVTYLGESLCDGCISLTQVTLGSGLQCIDQWAFATCENLAYNEFDNALYLGTADNPYFALISTKDDAITSCQIHDDAVLIAVNAFDYCQDLTQVIIGRNLAYLGDYAFSECYSLDSIVIPDSVTTIGEYAFYYCATYI